MRNQQYKDNFKLIDFSKPLPQVEKKKHLRGPRSSFPSPMISRDYEAYECPVTGNMIEGRTAHAENLKLTGCRLLEDGEFEHNKKHGKAEHEARIDTLVDQCVDKAAKDFL